MTHSPRTEETGRRSRQQYVDFETRIISIRRSAPKWLVVEKSPKSNRHRRVDVTPELAAALEKIRHGGELVICNPDGSKLRPGQFHEILWAAQRKSGLPSFHCIPSCWLKSQS